MATPYALVVLDQTSSTQDEARRRHAGSPVLVVTGVQTRGRGRSGSAWATAPRAAAMSLAFAPRWPTATWPRLALAAGLAAHRVLGPSTTLKWPNDVLLGDGKVAGVLVEASGGLVVAGLGVNLWWPEPPGGFVALHPIDPGPEEMVAIAEGWAMDLLDMVDAGPDDWGIDEYRAVCTTVGKELTWEPDGAGKAVGVNEDGSLAVQTSSGVEALSAGAVHEVRPV